MTQVITTVMTAFVSSCSILIKIIKEKGKSVMLPEDKKNLLALLSSVFSTTPWSAVGLINT